MSRSFTDQTESVSAEKKEALFTRAPGQQGSREDCNDEKAIERRIQDRVCASAGIEVNDDTRVRDNRKSQIIRIALALHPRPLFRPQYRPKYRAIPLAPVVKDGQAVPR